jgi:radical SAM superfamily enzyme
MLLYNDIFSKFKSHKVFYFDIYTNTYEHTHVCAHTYNNRIHKNGFVDFEIKT